MSKMKKIAFVNQRYGLEVNGGSEYYTREIAEHLKDEFEIEVLTTKAVDYVTWKNEYSADIDMINGVKVHRFPVTQERDMRKFGLINQRLLNKREHTEEEEQEWFDEQGPLSPAFVQYVKNYSDEYDAFIFVTYLYYLTVMALPEVAEKAILIPTAHDEPYIYFKRYQQLFNMPKAVIYLTDEEKKFVNHLFHNQDIMHEVMGVGIDVPDNVCPDAFKETHHVQDYLVYVGRIDESKGCSWLFRYFEEYKKRNSQSRLQLVLIGKTVLKIPKHPDIISLGFVSEEEKFSAIAGARALVLPSEFESLSISVLEAMALGVPVIVNGRCEVLKGHCTKSNGGLYYKNYFEFEGCLKFVENQSERCCCMGDNARIYVNVHFRWDVIVEKFKSIIDYVIKSSQDL